MNKGIRISQIELKNMLGITEMSFVPGKGLTVIKGKNASNKTSVLSALEDLFKGGHHAELIKEGSKQAEAVIVFDDGFTATKKITKDDCKLVVTDDKNRKISSGKTEYINQLIKGAIAINPIQWMTAKPVDQLVDLLNAIPMSVSIEEIQKSLGNHDYDKELFEIDFSGHALKVLGEIETVIYDERTESNLARRQRNHNIDRLNDILPDQFESSKHHTEKIKSIDSDIEKARKYYADIDIERAAKKEKVIADAQEAKTMLENAAKSEHQKIIADADAAYEKAVTYAKTDYDKQTLVITEKYSEQEKTQIIESNTTISPLETQKALLQQEQESAIKYEGYLDLIKKDSIEIESLSEKIEDQNTAIDTIRQMQKDRLRQTPIQGLSIVDGLIYYSQDSKEPVVYSRLNEAEKLKLAFKVCTLAMGEFRFMYCDGLERLDSDNFEVFTKLVEESNIQLLGAKVTDDQELTIVEK